MGVNLIRIHMLHVTWIQLPDLQFNLSWHDTTMSGLSQLYNSWPLIAYLRKMQSRPGYTIWTLQYKWIFTQNMKRNQKVVNYIREDFFMWNEKMLTLDQKYIITCQTDLFETVSCLSWICLIIKQAQNLCIAA